MNVLPIPSRVNVGPYIYEVRIVEHKLPALDGDGWSVGRIEHHQRTITIVEGPARSMVDTYFHELTHAIDYLMNTGLSESQVTGVGTGLFMVALDNRLIEIKE